LPHPWFRTSGVTSVFDARTVIGQDGWVARGHFLGPENAASNRVRESRRHKTIGSEPTFRDLKNVGALRNIYHPILPNNRTHSDGRAHPCKN
jgi:hypothetical protein